MYPDLSTCSRCDMPHQYAGTRMLLSLLCVTPDDNLSAIVHCQRISNAFPIHLQFSIWTSGPYFSLNIDLQDGWCSCSRG